MTESKKYRGQITLVVTTRDKLRALCKKYGISYNVFILYSIDLFEREVAKAKRFDPTKAIKRG